MATKPESLQHMAGPKAIALAAHIDGAQPSADLLCRSGFPGPVAVRLAELIKAGQPCVEHLRQMGWSSEDARATSAAIVARGAH